MPNESSEVDILEKYNTEFLADTQLDELNIKEKALTIVAIKHKWVGRLIRHKIDLKKLEKIKKNAISKVSTSITKSSVELTETAAKKVALNSDIVIKIDNEIEKIAFVVEYLEKIERILNSMTYDIKNVIDIQKLETL